MALLEPLMVKNFEGISNVSLTPPAGKSLRVVDIVLTSVGSSAIIKVGKTYVGYIAKGENVYYDSNNAAAMNQFLEQEIAGAGKTLMRKLQEAGLPMVYPVAEGETFSIEFPDNIMSGYIVYQLYEAGDVKNTEVNGSASDHYIFINYGKPSASITPPNYVDIDFPLPPAPFPDFPFGDAVPAGKKILFHSLLINAWSYNSYTGSADHIATAQYLKLMKDTEVLFDADMKGFAISPYVAASGYENVISSVNGSIMPYGWTCDSKGILLFNPPLEFDEGSIVHVQEYVVNDTNADSIPLTIPYLGIVEEVIAK